MRCFSTVVQTGQTIKVSFEINTLFMIPKNRKLENYFFYLKLSFKYSQYYLSQYFDTLFNSSQKALRSKETRPQYVCPSIICFRFKKASKDISGYDSGVQHNLIVLMYRMFLSSFYPCCI